MSISPIPELVAELAAGRMVILVDEEDRENEGDLVLAADHVTPGGDQLHGEVRPRADLPDAHARARCERLQLTPMAARNGQKTGTAFTVSIEAARASPPASRRPTARAPCRPRWARRQGQRPGAARPHLPAAGAGRRRADARRPHRGRLRPRPAWPAWTPAAVICEVMKDDGTMARRSPDLVEFGCASTASRSAPSPT